VLLQELDVELDEDFLKCIATMGACAASRRVRAAYLHASTSCCMRAAIQYKEALTQLSSRGDTVGKAVVSLLYDEGRSV
jgi:hypothetical protein